MSRNTGIVRLIKEDGTIRYSKQYLNKTQRRETIDKWSNKRKCFIHVLPTLTGKDVPVEEDMEPKEPKKRVRKKKSDPEIQAKYVNKIYHFPQSYYR